MYDDDPFAPIGGDEAAPAEPRPNPKEIKTPIIPVPADAMKFSFRHPQHGVPSGKWAYHQADGRLVGYAVRFDFEADGKRAKVVLPVTYCSIEKGNLNYTAWRSCGVPEPRPFYRLPQLAAAPGKPIIFTEGEKKADRAVKLFPDHEATTTMGGAKAPHRSDFSWVVGRSVTAWPDNDEAGRAYARSVAKLALAAGAKSAAIVQVPANFPPKWDLADALPPGVTPADLKQLLADAVPVEIERDSDVDDEDNETSGLPLKQADILLSLADEAKLFHAPDKTNFADIEINGHRETWAIRRRGFSGWLRRRFYDETFGAPNSSAFESALGVIEAKAQFEGVERQVFIRVGGHEGRVYIDLGDETWRAVEIDADGWRVVERPPVRFRRSAGMLPLPVPERGGSIESLRSHINVKRQSDFVVLVAWLLAAFRECGPYPVLVVSGEQGSAKSTLVAFIRSLIDPNAADLRTLPREERDLYVSAVNGHVLAYDNISGLPDWFSDAVCRLATGGAHAIRQLYSDQDEVLFTACRPVILNGIEDVASRADLADRVLALTLTAISENERRPEQELRAEFERDRPQLLGALLDAVAHGLRKLPETKLAKHPRMADFAKWSAACETAFWTAGTFWDAYAGNRQDAVDIVLEGDEVATAVRKLMSSEPEWSGTAKHLLALLDKQVGDEECRRKRWPTTPRAVAGRLRRAAPGLRSVGIEVAFTKEGRSRTRSITITAAPKTRGAQPSAPSASPATKTECSTATSISTEVGRTVGDDADGRADEGGGGTPATVRTNPLKTHSTDAADDADANCATESAGDQKSSSWKVRV